MIKYLFILINSLSLFIFGLLRGDGEIKVTNNFPATLNAGVEIPVEIRITKVNLAGFGRLQLEVPEGFTIKNTIESDYEFSFEENTAKWIWASLPTENEIVIKMTMLANKAAVGEKVLRAKFSYVENNEKQITEMPVTTINVVTEGEIAKTPVPKVDSTVNTLAPVSNAEPPGNIIVERFIKKSDNKKDYIVTIKINKRNTKGFARYSDDAHENVTAKSLKTDGGSFSIADGKIKFVWVNVPEKDELEVSYTLSGSPNHTITLNGEYSYLEDSQSKKVVLSPEMIEFLVPVKEVTQKKPDEVATKSTDKPSKVDNTEKINTSPSNKDGNADFNVQIGAFVNTKVNAEVLKQKFNVNELIRSEMQEGFSKFMVGSHKDYKKARTHTDLVKTNNGIKSAFVVAYNDGKRITVQEALMITSQKWFK
jgi:hypothetical protein